MEHCGGVKMAELLSFSYALSGNTVYQGFPYPGAGKVGANEFIRIHNLGQFLYPANTGDSCYWDAFNAPRMFGHLGSLGYCSTGAVCNINGVIDLPPGAYLGWTYNGNDATTIGKAWAIYEILTVPPGENVATIPAGNEGCSLLEKMMRRC